MTDRYGAAMVRRDNVMIVMMTVMITLMMAIIALTLLDWILI